jgi:YHS domain-containing protein
MKNLKFIGFLIAIVAFTSFAARADDTNVVNSATNSVKPDLLTTCPVSGEKLGEMGKPYVFVYKGQEVKLCCPDCKEKFDEHPDKYIKIIRAADKTKDKPQS